MQYSIWYMRKEWFIHGVYGEDPDPDNLDKTHIFVKNIDVVDENNALQKIYYHMQAENWSGEELIESKGLIHISMSVGDIIVQDSKIYLKTAYDFHLLNE